MRAINLRTEYLKDPIGIDIKNPRFMWNCEGGKEQSAYRIVACDTRGNTLWDSGRVESSQMTFIPYPLETPSRLRVNWKVKLWDENGEEGDWSEPAFFEIGLKNASDWSAKWITGDYRVDRKRRYPVDCFKKEFACKKPILSARLYMTACGLYSAEINGVGCSMPLAPGVTEYRKRIQYQTYDVTELLHEGENVICAELADGWYRGSVGAWGLKNQYGTETKLLAQLEIKYTDGTAQSVISESSWLWSNDGAIRFADNKDGERVNANMTPSYGSHAKETKCSVLPSASNNFPIAEKERFKPVMSVTPSGKRLLDFGQNIAGYIEFEFSAREGQRINLEFGELLHGGELTLDNIQCKNKHKTTPLQRIEYVCKDGLNRYKTKFAIFGFQYVSVETDINIKPEDFTAIAVYSDMDETGAFSSSNELLNKFVEATKWSAKGNSTDLPTDCPTRERHGWTGDAQIFCKTASYLFNYAPFAEKFVRDMCDEQLRSGNFRQIAPRGGVDFYMTFMDGSAGWSDAGVFIPYRLYKQYGDSEILKRFYPNMRAFAEYKIKTLGKWYPTALPTGVGLKNLRNISNYRQSYGEWAEPKDVKALETKDFINPNPEETTAYIVYMLETMADIARVLGMESDRRLCEKNAARARKGYGALVSTKKFTLDTDRQAKLVRPLYIGLLDEKQTEYAKKRLIKALDNYGWRLGTGFLSTPLILSVLADINIEYAYRLLENEQMPGWLFMPKNGANTVWESWEGTAAQGGIASLNHYSKGAVCEWLFGTMCGINVAGENRFEIAPRPGGHFEFAEASYDSVYGRVSVRWDKKDGGYKYRISVPSNCKANIILPDGRAKTVGAGEYEF